MKWKHLVKRERKKIKMKWDCKIEELRQRNDPIQSQIQSLVIIMNSAQKLYKL